MFLIKPKSPGGAAHYNEEYKFLEIGIQLFPRDSHPSL